GPSLAPAHRRAPPGDRRRLVAHPPRGSGPLAVVGARSLARAAAQDHPLPTLGAPPRGVRRVGGGAGGARGLGPAAAPPPAAAAARSARPAPPEHGRVGARRLGDAR